MKITYCIGFYQNGRIAIRNIGIAGISWSM